MGKKDDGVAAPFPGDIRFWVVGQAAQLAAPYWHDVYIPVIGAAATEGDAPAVTREDGKVILVSTFGQSLGCATGTIDSPQVTGVRKDDDLIAHRDIADQHPPPVGLRSLALAANDQPGDSEKYEG